VDDQFVLQHLSEPQYDDDIDIIHYSMTVVVCVLAPNQLCVVTFFMCIQ